MEQPTSGQRLMLGVLVAVVAAMAALAPAATAAVTVPVYKITSNLPAFPRPFPADGPSTLQAGANPNAGSYTTFTYPNATEDVKTALTNFAPGLLGNPESVPKCPAGGAPEPVAAPCPAGSQIGTSRLDVAVAAGGASPVAGFTGNRVQRRAAGERARSPRRRDPTSPARSWSPRSRSRSRRARGGDYGLTGTLTDIARLDVCRRSATCRSRHSRSSSTARRTATCATRPRVSRTRLTGQAIGYDDPTFADGPPYAFATFGCEQIPFAPKRR